MEGRGEEVQGAARATLNEQKAGDMGQGELVHVSARRLGSSRMCASASKSAEGNSEASAAMVRAAFVKELANQ